MMRLLVALRILKEKNFFDCSMEGDSKTVINWGGGGGGGKGKAKGSWRLHHLICEA